VARAFLCSSCGQIMGRMLGVCPVCRGKNLVFYDNDRSPALLQRQRQIQGTKRSQSTPAQANSMVLIGLCLFMGGGFFFINYFDEIVCHPLVVRTISQFTPGSGPVFGTSQQVKASVATSGRRVH